MPELPEVEIIRLSLEPVVTGREITRVIVRNSLLRRPVSEDLPSETAGEKIHEVIRRGKYLLFRCSGGTLIIHLGMTGKLTVVPSSTVPSRHDHLDFVLAGGLTLRFTDPRRFGLVLWTRLSPLEHPLLRGLGLEPLSPDFSARHLILRAKNRILPIKQFLMDHHVVAGVGNIYANESLFLAGLSPFRPAQQLTAHEHERLVSALQSTLRNAISAGRNHIQSSHSAEKPEGYFPLQTWVYGRSGKPCRVCGSIILRIRNGRRSTYLCPSCQKEEGKYV